MQSDLFMEELTFQQYIQWVVFIAVVISYLVYRYAKKCAELNALRHHYTSLSDLHLNNEQMAWERELLTATRIKDASRVGLAKLNLTFINNEQGRRSDEAGATE